MLPEGWAKEELGRLTSKIGSGATPRGGRESYSDQGTPLIRSMNIHSQDFRKEGLAFIDEAQARLLNNVEVEPDDVLLNITGASIGRVCLAPAEYAGARVNQHVCILRSLEVVLPHYIEMFLAAPEMQSFINEENYGLTRQALTKEMIEGINLPLPPLAEQRRIVAKLDALTARLTRTRAELERVDQLATQLRSVALAEAFKAPILATVSVSTIVSDVRYGTAKKCDYGHGTVYVLRIPNVQAGTISLSDLKSADFDTKERSKLALIIGDILVIRSNGSVSLVGRSAVVDQSAEGMLYAGYLIRLRVKQDLCLPEYLHLFLQSGSARSSIEGAARSTSGVHNVNAEQLKALRLPVPELEVQRKIVSQVTAAFARADRLEAEAARARALLDRLEAAILAKAFRGELVPQDPADEPASVLLDRIRAEHAAAPKPKRGRRAQAPRPEP